MKPPRLSLAICHTPPIIPVPAVIRIRITMEFQVQHDGDDDTIKHNQHQSIEDEV